MNSLIPKQFAVLAGKPVLMHTINAFYRSDFRPEIIVVLHPGLREQWNTLCLDYSFDAPHTVISGGAMRYDSVKNALSLISPASVVAIHDAVRPVISNPVITNAYLVAEKKGAAVTAIPSRDSVRLQEAGNDTSRALNREEVYLVQTPQTFRSELITNAYKQPFRPAFTDDASVAEAAGYAITLVEGSTTNIKITYPEDLLLAEILLKQENPAG
jgi:2-C-methyl-D-erythritol 4-phosphate cytidylyltransferase